MSVWYVVPSAKAMNEPNSLPLWRGAGYCIAVFRDTGAPPLFKESDIMKTVWGEYKGYPNAVNRLIWEVFKVWDLDAKVVITGGDDIDPDPNAYPDVIEKQFLGHFHGTFGVMQPTGDRWMVDKSGRAATERVCESPWIGKDFALRMYEGNGPFCEEYYHFFCDEELHDVAMGMNVLWHRNDLIQYHHHWSRERRSRPPYLHPARLNWDKAKQLYLGRKSKGFPGHTPLPKESTLGLQHDQG